MSPTYVIPVVVELVFYGGGKKYNKQLNKNGNFKYDEYQNKIKYG